MATLRNGSQACAERQQSALLSTERARDCTYLQMLRPGFTRSARKLTPACCTATFNQTKAACLHELAHMQVLSADSPARVLAETEAWLDDDDMPPAAFSPQRQALAPVATMPAAGQSAVQVPPCAPSPQAWPQLSHRSLQAAAGVQWGDAQHAASMLHLPDPQQSPLRHQPFGTSPRRAPSRSPCGFGAAASAGSPARKRVRTSLRFDSSAHSPLLDAFKRPAAQTHDAPVRCSSSGGHHGASPAAPSKHHDTAHGAARAAPQEAKQGTPLATPKMGRSPWRRLRDAANQRAAGAPGCSGVTSSIGGGGDGSACAGFAAGAMLPGVSGDGDLFTQSREGVQRSPVPSPLKQLVNKNLFGA